MVLLFRTVYTDIWPAYFRLGTGPLISSRATLDRSYGEQLNTTVTSHHLRHVLAHGLVAIAILSIWAFKTASQGMLMVDFDHKLREVSDTRAINGAVHVYYPITKVVQGLFPEEKLPVVEVGRRVNG